MKTLFDATQLKSLTLKNRFFKAATYEGLATDDGRATAGLLRFYEDAAKGGAGTILTSYAYVVESEQPNPRMLGVYSDALVPALRELASTVHEHGANIVMQLVYGGSWTRLSPPSPVIWDPSAVRNERSGITPTAMTRADMQTLSKAFASAAVRAQQAGFDGVELHAAHGYMLSQFLSPFYNRRTDEYGGSIENRVRFIGEVLDAIRAATCPGFLVMAKFNSEDGVPGGLTAEDSLAAVKLLESRLDAVEVSGGTWRAFKVRGADGQESFYRDYAAQLAREVAVPVVLTGGHTHLSELQACRGADGRGRHRLRGAFGRGERGAGAALPYHAGADDARGGRGRLRVGCGGRAANTTALDEQLPFLPSAKPRVAKPAAIRSAELRRHARGQGGWGTREFPSRAVLDLSLSAAQARGGLRRPLDPLDPL